MAILLANLAQRVWYIDPVNGLDTNSGLTAADAIKTLGAYVRRCGAIRTVEASQGFVAGQGVDIYLLGDMPATDRQQIGVTIVDATLHFRIHGSNTLILQGNITSFTATVPSATTQATIAHPSFTSSHVGKRIVFPSLGLFAGGAWSTVIACPSAGTLEIDDPKTYNPTVQTQCNRETPSQTEAFQILDCTVAYIDRLTVNNAWAGGSTVWPPPVWLENVKTLESITFDGVGGFFQNTLVRQCKFLDVQHLGGASTYFRTCAFTATVDSDFGANPEIGVKFSGAVFFGTTINFRAAIFGLHRQDSNVFANTFNKLQTFATSEGRVALRSGNANPLSGFHLLTCLYVFTHDTDEIYSPQASGSSLFTLARGSKLTYTAGGQMYSASGVNELMIGGAFWDGNAQPSLKASAGAVVPAVATCRRWSQLLASPFSGRAYDNDTLNGVMPDNI